MVSYLWAAQVVQSGSRSLVIVRFSRACGIVEAVGLLYQHFGYGLLGVSVVEQPGELHQFDPDLVINNQVIAL